MAYKHLNQENLIQVLQLLNTEFGTKVDKVEGFGLSKNDFSDELLAKLNGIEAGAQVNKLEKVKVNGTEQAITDKAVDITVPTKTSELTNDSTYVTEQQLTDGLAAKADKATTLAGYGITDAYTQTETDTKIADAVNSATGGESAASVKTALEAYQTSNDARVKAIEDDYLKAADKTELANAASAASTAAGAAQTTADEAKAAAATNAANITSGDAATLQSAKDYADEKIAAQISSAYKAAGTIEYESLPEPSADVEGNVYNISNAFTTDADFVEGAGKQYVAGTNVVIIEESEGVFKYDVLAMSFDGFVQEADIQEFSESEIQAAWDQVFGA